MWGDSGKETSFSFILIGKYSDEVLCDVFTMHVGHLLLERPWEFDRRATKDGNTNRYSFVKSN